MKYLYDTIALITGIVLDLCIGDPPTWPHPVRFMGKLIGGLENFFRAHLWDRGKKGRLAGFLIWTTTVAVFLLLPLVLLTLAYKLHPFIYVLLASFMNFQLLACKSLRDESMRVKEYLDKEDLPGARQSLSRIVGRDTKDLDEEHIVRAAVETVAENTNDGVIAPLFYMTILGPLGGFVYKAVNTMDSMLGYKNERYKDLGFFAAKADDLFGFIPARLTAFLMLMAGFFLPGDDKVPSPAADRVRRAFKIFLRDRYKSESPNSAQSEAVMAGLLGIELLGPASYFGKRVERPALGEPLRRAEREDIKRANRVLYLTLYLAAFLSLLYRMG